MQDLKTIVVVDDDEVIHMLWDVRLEAHKNIQEIVHIRSIDSLRYWVSLRQQDLKNALFLVDYELGHAKTGLDAVEELSLEKQAVLITTLSDEPALKNRCNNDGIPLFPKSFLTQVEQDLSALHPSLHSKAA